MTWRRIVQYALLVSVTVLSIFVMLRQNSFSHKTDEAISTLGQLSRNCTLPSPSVSFDSELSGLPSCVSRYLRKAIPQDGSPVLKGARLVQAGEFLMNPPSGYKRFLANEYFAAEPPSFVWEAWVRAFGPVNVMVRDSFLGGEAGMHVVMLGMTLVSEQANPSLNEGALVRFLAELVMMPTSLLPSRGVVWARVSEHVATATLTVGKTVASVDVTFSEHDDLPETVYCKSRPKGLKTSAPWFAKVWNYKVMGTSEAKALIPTRADVAWVLADGTSQVYWKGEIMNATFI